MIAALYVETGGCYFGLPDIDPWDEKRDARLYDGPYPVIAHPPCTRMANSGVMWLEKRNLWDDLDEATTFFNHFVEYGKAGNKIAIENPIPHKYAVEKIGKYSQVIQPYMFGHTERKATCLWLFGLPELKETNNVMEEMKKLPKNEQQRIHYLPPGKERAKLRSKTFPGIAQAIATQYGSFLLNGY